MNPMNEPTNLSTDDKLTMDIICAMANSVGPNQNDPDTGVKF